MATKQAGKTLDQVCEERGLDTHRLQMGKCDGCRTAYYWPKGILPLSKAKCPKCSKPAWAYGLGQTTHIRCSYSWEPLSSFLVGFYSYNSSLARKGLKWPKIGQKNA